MPIKRLRKYTFDLLEKTEAFSSLKKRSFDAGERTLLYGLRASSLPFVIGLLSRETQRPICVVTANAERAEEVFDDLSFFGFENVFHFPKWEILPYEKEDPVLEISAKRFDTYHYCASAKDKSGNTPTGMIVTSIESMLQRVIPPKMINKRLIELEFGDEVDIERLAEKLTLSGYERTPNVESRGEFSIRGGIIDIYPINTDFPIRIDLFGNEIEEIRYFDVSTQRSLRDVQALENVIVLPLREKEIIYSAVTGGEKLPLLSDIFPNDAIVVRDNPDKFELYDESFRSVITRQFDEAFAERGSTEADHETPLPPEVLYTTLAELNDSMSRFPQILSTPLKIAEEKNDAEEDGKLSHPVEFRIGSFDTIKPSLDTYLSLIRKRQAEDYVIVIVCDNDGQATRLDELLRENEISAVQILEDSEHDKFLERAHIEGYQDIVLTVGMLHNGFSMREARVMFLTDREIFGRYKRRRIYRKIYKGAGEFSSVDEIKRGDYVVHINHGIGIFQGIRQQQIDGRTTDLIEILYKDNDKLLVPIDKIKHIQKYSAVEGAKAELDKLGGNKWNRRKSKTKKIIEEMAEELLSLYAKREICKGFEYSPDTVWQSEFEASFIYQETPDQIKTIIEVKQDMISNKPMDRLVCGDVGYGKTEVAIRAVFKAVQDKKQVAVLVPTTILAQQHYKTFSERFAEYPLTVEMLSRFRTPKQQREILKRLKDGELNVLIGTHRLLSKDVEFFELGLVIVDEEQRFGVRHKEKLKELRTTVDYMTLTATPIPRTLYMSLSGLRDLSIINTPPADRHPIKTKIIHFDREQIEEAILRELNRDGQIFFVHNRVHNINDVAQSLAEMVPHARIAVAHGQMKERELEDVMIRFVDGEFDILVSTTIIENGLDIPNVNTIIINRADAFGLAQLYQLRGRVGRDVRRAYAYLIVPHGKAITASAVKRLAAIEEFTELGVGFNIAMRDMEIRGTGNILGKEQHGCITSIGFELYCRLLEETVQRLKGLPFEKEREVEIKLSCDAFIPGHYIPVESQRVSFYRKLSRARRAEEVDDVREELADRFGEIPDNVNALLTVTDIRIAAAEAHITIVCATKDGFRILSPDNSLRFLEALDGDIRKSEKIKHVAIDENGFVNLRIENWVTANRPITILGILKRLK